MFTLGVLIGIFEIVAGTIVLIASATQGEWISIIIGVSYILSGVLFIWLCSGSYKAHVNEEKIKELNDKIRSLEHEKDVLRARVKVLEGKNDLSSKN